MFGRAGRGRGPRGPRAGAGSGPPEGPPFGPPPVWGPHHPGAWRPHFGEMGFTGMHDRQFGGHCGESLLDGIDLTDEQIEKIMEVRQESFAKIAHARIEMGDLRRRLMKELGADKIDRSKISALTKQIKEQKSALTDLMVDKLTAHAEILTPEQRKSMRMRMMKRRLGLEEEQPEDRDDE